MDRVRFGRALGYGARHAAKAVVKAVDAATAPNPAAAVRPQPSAGAQAEQQSSADEGAFANARSFVRPTSRPSSGGGVVRTTQARAAVRQGKAHASHLRRHMWSPLAKFSSVVWLQVTGTFFALIAAFLSQGLWKDRGAVRLPVDSPTAGKFYLHAAAFVIFAYFAVSSFVRAYVKQRR